VEEMVVEKRQETCSTVSKIVKIKIGVEELTVHHSKKGRSQASIAPHQVRLVSRNVVINY